MNWNLNFRIVDNVNMICQSRKKSRVAVVICNIFVARYLGVFASSVALVCQVDTVSLSALTQFC